jgi:VIT1/CCC1 family predicted Fe2+/Mn2+ transporter
MNLTTLPGKAAQFAGSMLLVFILYTVLRQAGLHDWTARDAEGLAVLIQLVGDIYAVLLAFMIFVIWTQFTEVENCVVHETDMLRELLRFSAFLNDESRSAIRKATFAYSQKVLNYEWPELGEGRRDNQTAEAFTRLQTAVVAAAPKTEVEASLRDHLLETLRSVSRARDERVAKSLTRMPPTLSGLVKLIAAVLLVLIFIYPFHQALAGLACVCVAALVLTAANFVMTDTDNPLRGVWNVKPDPFSELPH